jgi:hypothetical protein
MPLTNLGKYTVTRPLGQGAMGEVYLAEDPDIGRSEAIKLWVTTPGPDAFGRGPHRGRFFPPEHRRLHVSGSKTGCFWCRVPGESLESRLQPHPRRRPKIMEGSWRPAVRPPARRGPSRREALNIGAADGECKLMTSACPGIGKLPRPAPSGDLATCPGSSGRRYWPAAMSLGGRGLYEMLSGENPSCELARPRSTRCSPGSAPWDSAQPDGARRVMACWPSTPGSPPDVWLAQAGRRARGRSRPAPLLPPLDYVFRPSARGGGGTPRRSGRGSLCREPCSPPAPAKAGGEAPTAPLVTAPQTGPPPRRRRRLTRRRRPHQATAEGRAPTLAPAPPLFRPSPPSPPAAATAAAALAAPWWIPATCHDARCGVAADRPQRGTWRRWIGRLRLSGHEADIEGSEGALLMSEGGVGSPAAPLDSGGRRCASAPTPSWWSTPGDAEQ